MVVINLKKFQVLYYDSSGNTNLQCAMNTSKKFISIIDVEPKFGIS